MLSKLIIDFKAVSPKHGDLFRGRNPVEYAAELERKGVLGLSVVTESEHFGGSLSLLRDICKAVSLPVIRKDFIQTSEDLKETADCGAAAVLLIAATCERLDLLYEKSLELGLKPLVEVHDAWEMEAAKKLGAKYIGINNKDIKLLEKDSLGIETTKNLIRYAPAGSFIVSESGMDSADDIRKAISYGADAALVGTAFWRGKIADLFGGDFALPPEQNRG
ncbi:MAG: indole-3-glycerol-phosphate synthase [Clostridiales Family XIII bacterium]|jgi:indole-3-glycerol phosphate synthase|nr:indole-3-glycerol-phosphate synthase [Clostridiales Family XIII bacterium]